VKLPKQLTDAVPSGSNIWLYRSGSTWNDGGAWHSAIFKLPDGTFRRVKMESDYCPDAITVEDVREAVETKTIITYEARK
jgi:hypothetical protein